MGTRRARFHRPNNLAFARHLRRGAHLADTPVMRWILSASLLCVITAAIVAFRSARRRG